MHSYASSRHLLILSQRKAAESHSALFTITSMAFILFQLFVLKIFLLPCCYTDENLCP